MESWGSRLAAGWQLPCTTPEPYRIFWLWNKDLVTLPWYIARCDHCQDTGIQENIPILRAKEETAIQNHFINKPRTARKNQWSFFFYSHSKLGVYFTGERSRKQSVTAQNNFHLSHIAAKVTFLNYHFRRHPQDQLSLLPHCDPEMLWLIQQNEIDVSVCSRSIAEPRAQTTAS